MASPYTPRGLRANATADSGVLAAIICVRGACARRPRDAPGDLTALLLCCRREPTAFQRHSFRSPWERRATARTLYMHKVRAVARRPRRFHGVQWRCHGDLSALWENPPRAPRRSEFFLARRAVPMRTPPWCDRDLYSHSTTRRSVAICAI